jgi:hypothetical protein
MFTNRYRAPPNTAGHEADPPSTFPSTPPSKIAAHSAAVAPLQHIPCSPDDEAEHVKPGGHPVDCVHEISQSTKLALYEHAALAARAIPSMVLITTTRSR